jgi:hypothetical protein
MRGLERKGECWRFLQSERGLERCRGRRKRGLKVDEEKWRRKKKRVC